MTDSIFHVLDRHQDIHRNYLLEASAGTGKTFSIENIVVRLLIGEEAIPIENILVVTFTRIATRDLRLRIRSNIEKAMAYLKSDTIDGADYLNFIKEQGEQQVEKALKKLSQSLFYFDQAQIFTIHGFCARMLRSFMFEGEISAHIDTIESGEGLQKTISRVIKDYLRTELRSEFFSKGQLKLIASRTGEELEKALAKIISKRIPISPVPSLSSQKNRFFEEMLRLKRSFNFKSEKIIADFLIQAPLYEKLCDRSKQVKREVLEKIERFATLFDKDEWNDEDFDLLIKEGLFILEALAPHHLKARSKPIENEKLNSPFFVGQLQERLNSIVEEMRNPDLLLARMAHQCQQLLQTAFAEEELISFDDLLLMMQETLKNPSFKKRIQQNYKAAIVDEFQDTDPLQWEIFRSLFLNSEHQGYLYLVGDPKQSIYAFRQADIYTYLEAAQAMGSHHATLNTNYRSQPSLVEALNILFSSENAPGLISLPRLKTSLKYQRVEASSIPEKHFNDQKGSLHFCLSPPNEDAKSSLESVEEQYFLPFFVNEIQRLTSEEGWRYGQFAILVSDRFQGKRVAEFLNTYNVPVALQRTSSLVDSPILPALHELITSILSPKNDSALKVALGGRIIGWTHHQIRTLEEFEIKEKILAHWNQLRMILVNDGIAPFFQSLMDSTWHQEGSVVENLLFQEGSLIEHLLSQEEGVTHYHDLLQLITLLLEQESRQHATPEMLLKYIDSLSTDNLEEDPKFKRQLPSKQEAVQILTLHASKGLEFDIVFPLGLLTRPRAPATLLPIGNPAKFEVVNHSSKAYEDYCNEIDAEKMRQLYVAMTRAKYRLYVPVALTSAKQNPEMGEASPMELFLARLMHSGGGYSDDSLMMLLDRFKAVKISYEKLSKDQTIESFKKRKEHVELLPPPPAVIPQCKQFIHSFTSLTKHSVQNIQDLIPPHDFSNPYKTAHTLPAGSQTGTILHHILETISYQIVARSTHHKEIMPLISSYLVKTPFADWCDVISKMVFDALKSPLFDNQFALCNVASHERYHEIEFLYPSQNLPFIEEFQQQNGFLKGVVDLVAFYKGKYYVIDWKSNWLGADSSAYGAQGLQESMEKHHYFLQADIYKQALKQYIKLFDERPFEDIFGGAYYLFLRGLSSPEKGIYKYT